jgi:hypothetical protein
MAADAGAQQILDLLNTPSQRLQDDLAAILKSSRRAPNKPFGVMPQHGVDAVGDMRSFYRELRAQIDAIETVDLESKANALEALDTLDRSFGACERSLELGRSKPAIPKLQKAEKRSRAAKKTMRDAIKGLSQ